MSNRSGVYDFDGDHADELGLLIGTSEHAGSGDFHGAVWTFRAGRIERYAALIAWARATPPLTLQ